MRHLIINGEDLGMSEGINKAIFDLHEKGILTSASVLVDGKAAQEAVLQIRDKYQRLSLGLHFNFGEPPFRIDKLMEETQRQWKKFLALVGSVPSHVDIHRYPDIAIQLRRFLPQPVPIRNLGSIKYINQFNGAIGEVGVSISNLAKILKRVKKGIYELSCHPGYEPLELDGEDCECGGLREMVVSTLMDNRIKKIMDFRCIELISYEDLAKREEFHIYILDRLYTTL